MLARLAAVAACTLTLTFGSTATAQAASLTLIDGPGDVWAFGGPGVNVRPSRVPAHEQGDILRTTFTHGRHAVVVRARFADLARRGAHVIFSTRLRTDTGLRRTLLVSAGRHLHWHARTILSTLDGQHVDCAVTHSIDFAKNVAVFRVPRICLENPRTVEAAFVVVTGTANHRFLDNPITHRLPRGLPPFTAPIPHG